MFEFANQYNDPCNFMNKEQPFSVRFIDEKGVDLGGSSREFISEVVKDIMNENTKLFIMTPNSRNECGEFRECMVPYNPSLRTKENHR